MGEVVRKSEVMSVRNSQEVLNVRQFARLWAVELGFSRVAQTKFVTATSELARNMLNFAGGGRVRLEGLEADGRRGLRLIFEDEGPGISDVELALKDGYSTGGGLGLGLGGARRLVDDFVLMSRAGEGTRVTITSWK